MQLSSRISKMYHALRILFTVSFLGGLLANPLLDGPIQETLAEEPKELDPRIVRSLLSTNFENGTMDPWLDESANNVHWVVENFSSPLDPTSPAPRPTIGSKYLRANRTPVTSSGLAVLRSRPFTALPDDQITFSFWLRSRHPQGNTLKAYWLNGTNEQLLVDVTETSSPSNFEWRQISAAIPITSPTDTRLIIYGYCGANAEDAIGIDDILLESTTSTTSLSTWATTSVPEDCNEFFNSLSGSFSSPNYPNNYPNNARCQWLIVLPDGYQVHLDFMTFSTESRADYVRIYDGASTSSPLLGTYSGSTIPNSIDSSSNIMLVDFQSNSFVTYRGFDASYFNHYIGIPTTSSPETTPYSDEPTTPPMGNCGGYHYYSGYIYTPNYPSNYYNGLDCYYFLDSFGSHITLTFDTFNTESCCDYVTVYNGWSTSGSVLLYRHSGNSVPSSIHNTYSSRLLVHFYSDHSSTASGFQAYFNSALERNSGASDDMSQQKERSQD